MKPSPPHCCDCFQLEFSNPFDKIKKAFELIDEAQRLMNEAINTEGLSPEGLDIINDVDDFNRTLNNIRTFGTYPNGQINIYKTGFDRILDDIDGIK
jgi:hypothetical protein